MEKNIGLFCTPWMQELLPAVPKTVLMINIFLLFLFQKTMLYCPLCRQNIFVKNAIKKPVEVPLIWKITILLVKMYCETFTPLIYYISEKALKCYSSSEFTFCVYEDVHKVTGLCLNLVLQIILTKCQASYNCHAKASLLLPGVPACQKNTWWTQKCLFYCWEGKSFHCRIQNSIYIRLCFTYKEDTVISDTDFWSLT